MTPPLLREKLFDEALFIAGIAGSAFGLTLERPVFIIGTGRCGTNLLVDLLRAHPRLSGFPGEANELWHPMLEPFESAQIDIPPIEVNPKLFSEISVANWRSEHRRKIYAVFTGFHLVTGLSKVFFTKSAMISFLIPEILKIFPHARFIHIYRFGPAVVESYFKKNFGKYSRYKFTEKEYRAICAKYWNACILEIDARKRDLSLESTSQILEIAYEDLCQDPGIVLNRLANFLAVDPDDFQFDVSTIASQNYKAPDYTKDPANADLLELMASGLKLKGYLREG